MLDKSHRNSHAVRIKTEMDETMKQKLQEATSGPIFFDEPLARFTTIRVGGPALAHAAKMPVFIFGGGSNLLIRDGGVRGIVLNLTRGFNQLEVTEETEGQVLLRAESGVLVPGLMNFLIQQGLTGLEFMAGIPASIGGALAMNAGVPDGEIGDRIRQVTILDKGGKLKTLDRKACGFAYRRTAIPRNAVIVEGLFELKRGDSDAIRATIEQNKAKRVETQPLNYPNLGSIFKNPPKRYVGKMIEETGLKDVRVGQARVSEKHGNFIINEGEATAKDVIALIGLIKDKVKERYNVLLETEVRVVGEE